MLEVRPPGGCRVRVGVLGMEATDEADDGTEPSTTDEAEDERPETEPERWALLYTSPVIGLRSTTACAGFRLSIIEQAERERTAK